MTRKAGSNQGCVSLDVIITECVDNWRGCSFIPQWVHIDIFIVNVFHPNDVIDTECVDRRRCSVFSIYPHIGVVIACTRGFVIKMLLLQNVWMGEEGVRLSVYTHILVLLLPKILDNVFSTLNKILPNDKSSLFVRFNSLLKNLWHCCKNGN